jgi:uncharacterized protein
MRFDWDTANTEHIARHDITPEEAEQVIESEPVEIGRQNRNGELRILHLGKTQAGRVLIVAVMARGELARVVTAYSANRKFRKFYAEEEAASHETDPKDT